MKTLIISALLSLVCFSMNAQTLKIVNSSNCKVNYYLSAADPACSSTSSTINYGILPGATVAFTFSTATWGGTTPSTGWQWQFIKEWNGCGSYTFPYPDCSGGVNTNVCAVGIPCSGLTAVSCMKMDMSCNSCSAVKTKWTTYPNGDVLVNIW